MTLYYILFQADPVRYFGSAREFVFEEAKQYLFGLMKPEQEWIVTIHSAEDAEAVWQDDTPGRIEFDAHVVPGPMVVPDIATAASWTGHPVSELWEGVDSPKHIWHAPGGHDNPSEPATLVAVMPGYREAAPELY